MALLLYPHHHNISLGEAGVRNVRNEVLLVLAGGVDRWGLLDGLLAAAHHHPAADEHG